MVIFFNIQNFHIIPIYLVIVMQHVISNNRNGWRVPSYMISVFGDPSF